MKNKKRRSHSSQSKRKLFADGLFNYDKLEPKNLLAGVVEAYTPTHIADPFVHDAVTYKDMVGRAATMPFYEGQLIVAVTAQQHGQQFENYLDSINWNQMLGEDVIGVDLVESTRTMMTVERGDSSVALVHVHFGSEADLFAAMQHLDQNDAVLWASPNFYQTEDPREFIPNDPEYPNQYHHTLMSNDLAWDITLGESEILVGITDDGVELFHSDLLPNIYQSGDFPFDGIDNDNNGYVDDANGWDFINANNDPNPDQDSHDHGTHVAGIAAGATNNNTGIAGTAGGATILPLQFYNYADWPAAVIAETFTYAADNGAHIVSTSYNINGWVGDPVFTAGMQYMYDAGVLALNSAGNGSALNPARQAFHQTLLVASSESDDTLSGFTNYGTGVDITAPGGSIYSTVTAGGYGTKSGTSMAAPNAAGVAALIWSANPTWTRDQVAAQLVGTGDNIDAQNPTRIGWMGGGRVNSFAALTETLAAPQIESVTGLPDDGVFLDDTTIDEFSIRFGQIMDPASINDSSNFDLRSAGLDDIFGTADDVVLNLDYNDYMISTNELQFSLTDGPMNYGHYMLTVNSGGVENPFGESLDGNGDGTGGDNYTQEFFISPPVAGIVGFDRGSYLVEDTVLISLGDANATGPITVQVTSTAGDSETVTLTDAGFGRYEGTINTLTGSIAQNDGVLQVALGHEITVTYEDADDGTGNPFTSEDTAVISNVIQFDSVDIPVSITDNNTITSIIPIALGGTVGDLDFQFDVTHTYTGDLSATLTSPTGTVVNLFAGVGGSGDNFENTYLDDEADTAIGDGTSPFAGEFQPVGVFADFDTELITGNWTLSITDGAGGDQGSLNAWSLFIDVVPASLGSVSLNQTGYNVGNTVEITVRDDNASTPVSVEIEASSGDMETIVLTEASAGVYVGMIDISDESTSADDGVLQGTPGTTFTVTYEDDDDGAGNTFISTAEANITNILRFDSVDTPLDINSNTTITSIINVPNAGLLVDLDLQLDITHTFTGDLDVFLTAPDGTVVELFSDIGGGGDNFENTYLDDEADTSIADGTAPYAGSFRPIGSFADFDGGIISGDWVLSVTDDAGGDEGTLNGWTLFMDVVPATIGIVDIDAEGYNVGETVNINVYDENGVDPISVSIVSTSGDTETVALVSQGNGLFTGSIVIDDNDSMSDDGLLQGSPGDFFTVTYVDSDDGSGNSATDSVTGRIQNIVHYPATDIPIDIVDNTTITSQIEILDVATINDLNVQVDITHTWDADLDVFLIAPDGTRVELFTDVGGSGDNFVGTVLDSDSDVLLANGAAPFTGNFQPEGDLNVLEGMDLAGIWTLEITDDAGGDTGTLDFWCIIADVSEGGVIPNIVVQSTTGAVDEGDSGSQLVDFEINLSQPSSQTVMVDYATVTDGFTNPATPGVDFADTSGTAIFQPGETTFVVSVEVFGDRYVELNEEFGLELTNAILGNITIGDSSVQVNNNDDFEFGVTVDFGTYESPVQQGAVGFTDEAYSADLGLGWTVQDNFNFVVGRGNDLTRDAAVMTDAEFEVELPNGEYMITAHFGTINRVDPFDIILEGVTNTFTPSGAGPNVSTTFMTEVTDGRLTMGLNGGGGLSNLIRMAGFTVDEIGGRGFSGGSNSGFANNPSLWGEASSSLSTVLGNDLINGRMSTPATVSTLSGSVSFDRLSTQSRLVDADFGEPVEEQNRVDFLNELVDEFIR